MDSLPFESALSCVSVPGDAGLKQMMAKCYGWEYFLLRP